MSWAGFASDLARGFSVDRYWKMYDRAKKSQGWVKQYHILRYMRYASKDGGYCGRTAAFKGKPTMPHGFHGVHISRNAVIGNNVTIFQNVTITNAVVGDNCFIGAGAILVGNITAGDNVRIGAGTVVVEDVPDNCTVVGAKPRVIMRPCDE